MRIDDHIVRYNPVMRHRRPRGPPANAKVFTWYLALFLANALAGDDAYCNVPCAGLIRVTVAPRHPIRKAIQMLKRTLVLLAAAMVALAMSATAAFAAIPAHPKFKSSAKEATWHNSNFMFQNDMWSCPQAACGSQTIWADGPNNWGAEANMANGNTAVLTYPDIARIFNNPRVSSFKLIRNGFTESMPRTKGVSAEAADDVWLDNYKIEMMMWVDNTGRSLAGSTHLGSAVI